MASFPTAIATLNNPTSTDKMNAVPHATQHTNANDEIEAIETALGVNMANVLPMSYLDIDGTLVGNSDTKVPSQKAVKTYADNLVLTGGGIPSGYLDTDGTLAANSDTKVATQKAVKTYVNATAPTLLQAWPIGSVYTSVLSANPSTLFGGTWSAFASGRCLVGVDVGQTEFDTVEETGGAKTHTLTTTELPAHTHTINMSTNNNGGTTDYAVNSQAQQSVSTPTTSSVGSGVAHNNLQPYITVYFFKRTA
jgi:hypothetical protein